MSTPVVRVWNSMILAVALIPLAIFWVGRADAFRPGAGETDETWPWHLVISGVYLLAVLATVAWVRWSGRKGIVAAVVAVAASVWAAMGFAEIATAYAFEAGIAGLPVTVAVWMLMYLAAGNAAWVALFSLVLAIRTRRLRREQHSQGAGRPR